MKNIYFIVLACLIIIYIVFSVRHDKLSVKTSFLWFIASIIMLLLSIFPYSIDWLAEFLFIDYPPALFLTLCIVFLIILDFNYSKKLEEYNKKIVELEQHIAILESSNEKK